MNHSKKPKKDPKISTDQKDSADPKAEEGQEDKFSDFIVWAVNLDWYLYGIGIIIIIAMVLATYFFDVRFQFSFDTFYSVFIVIQCLAISIWITIRLYSFLYHIDFPSRWLSGGSRSRFSATFLGTAFLILSMGSCEMPATLTKIIAPMVCPVGFEKIVYMGGVDTQRGRSFSSDWRYLTSESRTQTCNGELGQYAPKRFTFLLSGITLLLIYCSLFFLSAWSVTRLNYFKLHRFIALMVTFGVFIPLVFMAILNPPLMSIVFNPINKLIYPGHAISLVEAVKKHNITMIQRLLADGGDINALNSKNESAFSVAHSLDDKEILALFAGQITGEPEPKKALLNQGLIYDAKNFFEQVKNNHIENVKLFLSSGFDIDTKYNGSTALTIAVQNRNKDMVQLLLDQKANANVSGEWTEDPLAVAIARCDSEFVIMLIKGGAAVWGGNRLGETPLMIACKAQCLWTAKYLVENKAEIDALTPSGTALLYAIEYAAKEEVPNPYNKKFTHTLDRIKPDSYELVKYLLEKGADPNLNTYRTGKTPLSRAKSTKVPELIKLLESYHAR